MTNPAAQPRRVLLASVVLVALFGMLFLLLFGELVPAVGLGLVAVAVIVAAARPEGDPHRR
jgi:hypothetical protein